MKSLLLPEIIYDFRLMIDYKKYINIRFIQYEVHT